MRSFWKERNEQPPMDEYVDNEKEFVGRLYARLFSLHRNRRGVDGQSRV